MWQMSQIDELSISTVFCGKSPGSSDSKVSAYNVGDLGSILGSGRSSGEGNGNPLQYSFFFFVFVFISWRLITLQYCSGFCHTLTWVSHGFTCIPHLGNPMDGGAWWATVHGVAKSWTLLNNFAFFSHSVLYSWFPTK